MLTTTGVERAAGRLPRGGLTLIEMLVAVTVTLIMLFAVLKLAQTIGSSASTGRAIIELAGEIRQAGTRLQADLDKRTATLLPFVSPGSGLGYFEYTEGPWRDGNIGEPGNPIGLMGEPDDILAFTMAATDGDPFTGVVNGAMHSSSVAEVVWWLRFNPDVDDANKNGYWDLGETKTLHRRLLLIRPDIPIPPGVDLTFYRSRNDLSVHVGTAGNLVANTLNDLARRENRFTYVIPPLRPPFPPDLVHIPPLVTDYLARLDGDARGEDIVLSRVLSFDIKAFDPMAPVRVRASGNIGLTPGDPGWGGAGAVGLGAFVDLNYSNDTNLLGTPARVSYFSGGPMPAARFAPPQGPPNPLPSPTRAPALYDTWSMHYERDGIDNDGDSLIDEGTDGVDNNGDGQVDDAGEFETSAPYPVPLRGIKVILRAIEPDSRQVRQSSIVADLMPE